MNKLLLTLLLIASVVQFNAQTITVQTPNGGESLVMLEHRIRQTLNELAAKHMGQHIALFAHGGVMDILYRIATQQDLQAPRTWSLTNTAINRLLWTPESVTLVGWADTSHLDEMSRDEH